jgi:hypothetical protein
MVKRIGFAKMRENVASFCKEYKKSSELSLTFTKLLPDFNALFSSKCAYTNILEKTHILKEDGSYFDLVALVDKTTFQTSIFVAAPFCFPDFYDTYKTYNMSNHLGVSVNIGESTKKEYSLLFDGEGKVSIAAYFKDGTVSISSPVSAQGLFLLNLLSIIAGILRETSTSKTKLLLKELIKKNPPSTVSNIYNYIEKNPKGIEKLFSSLNRLDAIISGAVAGCMKSTNAEGNGLYQMVNHLVVRVGENLLPYLITEEHGVPALKLDVTSTLIPTLSPKKEGFLLPALILFKKQGIVPYFFRQYAFNELLRNSTEKNKKKNKPSINRWDLEEKDKKLEELVFAEKMEYQSLCKDWKEAEYQRNIGGYYPANKPMFSTFPFKAPAEKNWEFVKKKVAGELEANVKAVLTATAQYLEAEMSKNIVAEQEATVAKVKAVTLECKKEIEEITCILGKIYKNEILMSNL